MLSIENLSKTYANGVQALQDVSLEIPRGMFGLLGPNGAGKSTLMRTIATLQDSDGGSIHLEDGNLDVLRDKHQVREVLGYLPQEFGLYPKITAMTLLQHLAALKGFLNKEERQSTVEALLRRTNLWEVRNRKLGTYSGGMRQRFGIAQALLGEPKLIIVDEPTAGLDPEERRRFLNLLSEIGENVVVILSTHIVDDVSELCTRMAVIDHGQVLLQGSPRNLIANLASRIWSKSLETDEEKALPSSATLLSTRQAAGQTVIRAISEGSPGSGFEPVVPDLEDVYFAALKKAWPTD